MIRRKKAQAITEYVLVIGVAIGAFIAMGAYIRRCTQISYRAATRKTVKEVWKQAFVARGGNPIYYDEIYQFPNEVLDCGQQRSRYKTKAVGPQTSTTAYDKGQANYHREQHYEVDGFTETADIKGDFYLPFY